MKTELGKGYRGNYSESALAQIKDWADQAAITLNSYARGEDAEQNCQIGAYFADAIKFERLRNAITDLMA